MTIKEAIKILKSKLDGSVDTSWEWTEAVRMAIQALEDRNLVRKAVEGLDPKTWWIPVSERLSDKEELVLVTDNGNIEFGKLICGLFGDLWLIWVDDCWTEATKVTAWMPLPEPYREDGE